MPDVLGGIIGLSQQYIKFPYTVGEQANKNAQFAAMSGFPNVIGTTTALMLLYEHRVRMNWEDTGLPLHLHHHITQEGFLDDPRLLYIQRGSVWPVPPPVAQTV